VGGCQEAQRLSTLGGGGRDNKVPFEAARRARRWGQNAVDRDCTSWVQEVAARLSFADLRRCRIRGFGKELATIVRRTADGGADTFTLEHVRPEKAPESY